LPALLQDWKDSYDGTGEGKVAEEAMPEPFIGDWFGAKLATLGLNPGAADPLQSRGGCFAEQVAKSSFGEWAKTDPYGSELWEAKSTVNPACEDGRRVNRHRAARVEFARRWLDNQAIDGRDLLMLELYRGTRAGSPASSRRPRPCWTSSSGTRCGRSMSQQSSPLACHGGRSRRRLGSMSAGTSNAARSSRLDAKPSRSRCRAGRS
jgi:hypothetical protein